MDTSSAYLFKGLSEGRIKKILAAGKEIPLKKGQLIIRNKGPS